MKSNSIAPHHLFVKLGIFSLNLFIFIMKRKEKKKELQCATSHRYLGHQHLSGSMLQNPKPSTTVTTPSLGAKISPNSLETLIFHSSTLMQSAFYTASSSHQFQLPWKINETQFAAQRPVPKKLKTCFKAPTFTNSLRTSIGYEPEESLGKEPVPATPGRLPVVIRRSGRVSRYFWDGNCLQLVGVDAGAASFSFNFDDGFRKLYRICSLAVRDFFIPKQVSESYMDYVKWKFLHRVFSSALQVLATQVQTYVIKAPRFFD